MSNKLIILFIFSVTPFAWGNPESNQIKMTAPFNILHAPFNVEFKGKRGTVFIGNYEEKTNGSDNIYFLTNNGNELHYVDYVYFEEIVGVFQLDFIDGRTHPRIIIFGRDKYDGDYDDAPYGFDYKFMELDLEYQDNKLSLTYTPVPNIEKWAECFEGVKSGKKLTCDHKDEKGLRAFLNKRYDIYEEYNSKLITNLNTVDISKKIISYI